MNVYIKSLCVFLMAIALMGCAAVIAKRSSIALRSLTEPRGSDSERSTIENELRNYYNEPGEGAVMVVATQKRLMLQFRETPMRSLRRAFFARHREDFKRFYAAGFDTLTVEAKREDGQPTEFNYDLSLYR